MPQQRQTRECWRGFVQAVVAGNPRARRALRLRVDRLVHRAAQHRRLAAEPPQLAARVVRTLEANDFAPLRAWLARTDDAPGLWPWIDVLIRYVELDLARAEPLLRLAAGTLAGR